MTDEKEILKDLLIDESKILKNLAKLVQKSKSIFQIQKIDGKIVFQNFQNLTNPERICVILIGKKFAKKLGYDVTDSLTITEISNELGIPSTTLSSPMKSLIKKRLVIKNEKNYEIAYHKLPEIFATLFGEENEH